MMIRVKKRFFVDAIRKIGLWIIIFGFLFEFPLMGFFTSRRLSLFLAIIVLIMEKKTLIVIQACRLKYIVFCIIGLVVCMFISIINGIGETRIAANEYFEPRYILYCIGYIIVMSIFVMVVFRSFYEFCMIYLSIIIFQAFAVYTAVISSDFRLFLYYNFFYGDNRLEKTVLNGSRIIGINLQGSSGSVILLTGIIILIYLVIQKKISNIHFSLCFFLILGATFFIGRTGLYLEILFLAYYFILCSNSKNKIVNILIILMMTVFTVQIVLLRMDREIVNSLLRWAAELLFSDTRRKTLNILREMEIPPLTHETIFGTNIMRGVSSMGTIIKNDSGYIQIYSSLGIFGAAIYYSSFAYLYLIPVLRDGSKRTWSFMFLLVCVMFIIEYKEPYIQKYVYSFVVYSLFLNESFEKSTGKREGEKWIHLHL